MEGRREALDEFEGGTASRRDIRKGIGTKYGMNWLLSSTLNEPISPCETSQDIPDILRESKFAADWIPLTFLEHESVTASLANSLPDLADWLP